MKWKAYKLAMTLGRDLETTVLLHRAPKRGKRILEDGEASAGYPITTHGPTMAADLGTANASFPKIKKQFVILGK